MNCFSAQSASLSLISQVLLECNFLICLSYKIWLITAFALDKKIIVELKGRETKLQKVTIQEVKVNCTAKGDDLILRSTAPYVKYFLTWQIL